MRHGSLFSGIGGFDLASEWMGWENIFHCEWNEFGQKVLNYYWPKAISYHDITKTDFSVHRGRIDILTGGFPCQPYSMAGKRKGKEDERHLWPEMLRCIREIQPTWVVGENVLGLVNWNDGLVFHEVQADLEAEGYEVQPYVLPAASVNAPHRRDRVWFVAYSDNKRRSSGLGEVQSENGEVSEWDNHAKFSNTSIQSTTSDSDISTKRSSRKSGGIKENWSEDNLQQKQWRRETKLDNRLHEFSQYATNSNGFYSREGNREKVASNRWESPEYKSEGNKVWDKHSSISGTGIYTKNAKHSNSIGQEWGSDQTDRETSVRDFFSESNARVNQRNSWDNFPTVSPICTRDDGISDRLDSITFSKWRNESIKAGGNAIVPQVVHQIFKAIEQYETTRNTQAIKTQS
jgi:DNA (cytosine-5)-methyltransferase 1